MSDNSKIEWTDATWNPITGCSIVSPGCTNCYAMRLAGTRLKDHPSRKGLTKCVNGNHVWTGEVRLNEQWLMQPIRWRKPRKIFVCAHGDLFHESVPDEWIDRVFGVMALAPQHTFQVLTKRSKRMQAYIEAPSEKRIKEMLHWQHFDNDPLWPGWPLPNVWLGVTAEDQQRADERIPDLIETPAAVRFVSVEPMLGPVDLTKLFHTPRDFAAGLHWIICGGESGHSARPMQPEWAMSLRDQCREATVSFFMKQMENGGKLTSEISSFPADLQIRQFPK